MDFQITVADVVFIGEHRLNFKFFEAQFKVFRKAEKFAGFGRVFACVFLRKEFGKVEVIGCLFQDFIPRFFNGVYLLDALKRFLGGFLIRPKTGAGGFCLKLGKFSVQSGDVKDTPCSGGCAPLARRVLRLRL